MRVIKFILLLLVISPLQAHDLWNVKSGNDWLITNGSICIVHEYDKEITHASIIPTRLSVSIANYDWQALTPSQKIACDNLMQATITTVLKAVPIASGTRPTRDITATTYTKIRVPDTSLCEGVKVKHYAKPSDKYTGGASWYKVVGLNLTTLCGEY